MTSPSDDLTFSGLVEARRQLVEDVQTHRESVNFFASPTGFWRTAAERPAEQVDGVPDLLELEPAPEGTLSGVTTTLTCFESLDTALLTPESSNPAKFRGLDPTDRQRLDSFVANASSRTLEWRSEGAARRYCVVRGAAPILRLGQPGDPQAIREAVQWVWGHVTGEPGRSGIYEVAPPRSTAETSAPTEWNYDDDETRRRYPPNAFLTFWGLASVNLLPDLRETLNPTIDRAELWLTSVVGREVAHQYEVDAGSTSRDPQQLAWAINALVSAQAVPLSERSEDLFGLVRAGLDAFFAQQLDDGNWETGRALFHYPEAGNAYCYTYETLAELIGLATDNTKPYYDDMRRLMRKHLTSLLRAKDALVGRSLRLGDGPVQKIGWSSGHHPHRTSPESWATATAFRFLQALRCLIGTEVREQAATRLQARRPRKLIGDLKRMGSTWDAGHGSAGDVLASLFLHPTSAYAASTNVYDPDRPQLSREWAHSALLYGPPGTGKTTMAEAVAGALGWDFVEVTPAEFLDSGMEMVSARADEIFRQLMELDRAVVLFDEIDELIRRRTATDGDAPTDMVGRFFTTTMLPRLTRLWDSRRVIFFANTNSISDVDPAIRRSQRFDATVLVLPPSLTRRMAMLPTELQPVVEAADVYEILQASEQILNAEDDPDPLGWFPFLRYDQLKKLEVHPPESEAQLIEQVCKLGLEVGADWTGTRHPRLVEVIRLYQESEGFQRQESSALRLVKILEGAAVPEGFSADGYPEGYARWTADTAPEGILDGAGRLS